MSLRRRFVLAFAAYGVALAGMASWLAWKISRDALEAEMDQRLTEVAAVAATAVYPSELDLLRPGDEDLDSYTYHLAVLQDLNRVVSESYIFTTGDMPPRILVASSDTVPIGEAAPFLSAWGNEIGLAAQNGSSTSRLFRDAQGVPTKYGFIEIADGREYMLGVRIPVDFLEPVAELRSTMLWGLAAALVVAVLLGGLLAGGIVQPLENLSKAAIRIQRGRLDRPIYSESDAEDEVTSLARAMERMRVAILDRDERLRLMLAQVAHEIRNPLGGLELFASAAASAEDPRERRRLIARVRAEVAALNRIIDDFLTFARPLNLQYEPVDVRAAIQEAADLAEAELSHEGRLDVWLPEHPLVAKVDPDQVKRAVLNLLRNAAQSGTNVRLWAVQEREELMIGVMDDGPGIAPEVRERIFEPFISDKQRGAGLGLAIVKKVAEAHGGRVEARQASDPKYGSGAEFRLYLAASDTPSTVEAPTPVG
jgi:signal transduction histidine kinase